MPDALDSRPLARFRVLDFTRMVAGPYCTQALGDLGAEIIKIESPSGDDSRRPTPGIPGGRSPMFLSVNRNKKSVVLDLKSPLGKAIALDLVRQCDVLVENFADGVMGRLGLGFDVAERLNPQIVYCSITGYGSGAAQGPPRPAYDGIIQAAAGLMAMTGEADGPPLRTPYTIIDTASGMVATSSILAALLGREAGSAAQRLNISLFDVALSLVSPAAIRTSWTGENPPRAGNVAGTTAPSDSFCTADGSVFISCGNDRLFHRLVEEALDCPELGADKNYATGALRLRNAKALKAAIEEIMLGHSTDHWMERFAATGVAASPVRSMTEVLASADAIAAGSIVRIMSDAGEEYRLIKSPHGFDRGREGAAFMPPPETGEHNDVVLRALLGWTEEQLDEARAGGAFGR